MCPKLQKLDDEEVTLDDRANQGEMDIPPPPGLMPDRPPEEKKQPPPPSQENIPPPQMGSPAPVHV